MNPGVLLVSTATRWLGTARMPRTLARAGFRVALLAPVGSLALKSRYVADAGVVSDTAIPMEWLLALIRMVDRAHPHWLVPCDEMAIRLLFTLVLDPPTGLAIEVRTRLVALITASLGDPRFYAASIDKTLLPAAAQALGVRVPPYAIANDGGGAVAFGDACGYPVVVKRRYGFAGEGVAIVDTRDELRQAAQRLLGPDQLDLGEHCEPRLLVQSFVAGAHQSQALVANNGEVVAGFAWERCVATRAVKGQTTVLRFVESKQTRDFSATLCRGLGLNGFFNTQFIVDAQTGEAYLLEINRRIVTHTHLGERAGCDLASALRRALDGRPPLPIPATVAPGGDTVVIFPRQWLVDPASALLRRYPVDVPWDEPELIEALLAMRAE